MSGHRPRGRREPAPPWGAAAARCRRAPALAHRRRTTVASHSRRYALGWSLVTEVPVAIISVDRGSERHSSRRGGCRRGRCSSRPWVLPSCRMPGRAVCPALGTGERWIAWHARGAQGQPTEPTKSAMHQGRRPWPARVPGWLVGRLWLGSGMPVQSGQIPPPWARWENEAPTTRGRSSAPFLATCNESCSAILEPPHY
jgi:hypothetical protein